MERSVLQKTVITDICTIYGGYHMKKAVFLGSVFNCSNVYSEKTRTELEKELDFIPHIHTPKEAYERRDELTDVSYIFSTWGMLRFTKEEIADLFPSLEAVFYAAGSVQFFASPFIESGVKVFSAWVANAVPVAQYTVAEILLALKGFFSTLHRHGDTWKNRRSPVIFPGIMDAKVGIIGAGMIGKMVIEELRRYPVEVLVYDKFASKEAIEALGGKKAELDEIFSDCFVISNHLANNPATVGMLNYSHFSKMRHGAVFINTGRGAQVVADDLIRALNEQTTRVAVLDVTDPEEPPQDGSPLYTMENVFLTPHIAGSLGNEVHRMAEYMLDEYRALTRSEPTKYEVTAEMLKTMA